MLNELEGPKFSPPSSHSGTVSLEKDKYLTLTPNLSRTRASRESQCTLDTLPIVDHSS